MGSKKEVKEKKKPEKLPEEELSFSHVVTAEFDFYEAMDGYIDDRGRITKTYPHAKDKPIKILIQPPTERGPDQIMKEISSIKSDVNEMFMMLGRIAEKIDGRL